MRDIDRARKEINALKEWVGLEQVKIERALNTIRAHRVNLKAAGINDRVQLFILNALVSILEGTSV